MSKLRVLDLFSGIGGFSLGLERTGGFETVAFCEIEPFCRRVLAKHWPEVKQYHDVRTLSAEQLRADGIAVDVICGGFPCQDISNAGLRAGIEGERSGLWSEIARLVRELRPQHLIVENVSALLGRGLDVVLRDLAACGYDAEWDCIPASAVGAPHRRDRVWLVAYPRGEQHQGRGDAFRRALAAGLPRAFVANTQGIGSGAGLREHDAPRRGRPVAGDGCGAVADTTRVQCGRQEQRPQRQRVGAGGEPLTRPDAKGDRRNERPEDAGGGRARGRPQQGAGPSCGGWWISEPAVGRVAHGVPSRVDRLHALGNAVVPQIPELIGRAILEAA